MISREVKIFYQFILNEDSDTSSYVTTATATICDPKFLAIDSNGKTHVFVTEPSFDGNAWQPYDKYKVFVYTLPKKVPFVALDTLYKLKRNKVKK
jgi:hypothetical protein